MTFTHSHAAHVARTRPSQLLQGQGVALDNSEGQRLIDAESRLTRLIKQGPGGLGGRIIEERNRVEQLLQAVPQLPEGFPVRDSISAWLNALSAARTTEQAEQSAVARTQQMRNAARDVGRTGR